MIRNPIVRNLALWLLPALLAACVPAAQRLPPDQPLVFAADYDALFDATLQAVTRTYVREPFGERRRFAVLEADRETGLITAASGRVGTNFLSATKTFEDGGSSFTLGLTLDFPPGPVPEHTVTLVLRPVAEGRASLIYSSTAHTGLESRLGNAFMEEVLERLEARFGPVTVMPQ